MERKWWKETVFYQIYPRSFQDSTGSGMGDLRGILQHVDYLAELGIGAVWLGPVYVSPNDDMGYDIADYSNIMPEFGTMEDWEALRDALHARGIKLMMDLVVNHTSDEHPWFVESRSSKDSPKRDYYIWREGKDGAEPNNWSSFFTPSAWEYDEASGEYYLHLFSKKQPDLNWENPAVRKEIYDMMTWWLDKGADGFRMDVINLLCKTPGLPDAAGEVDMNGYVFPTEHMCNVPPIHEVLQEMAEKVYADKDIFTVGECISLNTHEAVLYTAGEKRELDACLNFAIIDMDAEPSGKWDYKPWTLPQFKKLFAKWEDETRDGWLGIFWSNQDQPRALSRFGTTNETYRMRCAKMLGTVLHLHRGTPFVYQGEEIGMVNTSFERVDQLRDVESRTFAENCMRNGKSEVWMWDGLHRKARDNARTPMPWNDSPNGGFTTGTPWMMLNPDYTRVNVAAAMANPTSPFHYYKRLIALRRDHLIMSYGDYALLWPEDECVFAFTRRLGDETWLIAANFKDFTCTRPWPEGLPAPRQRIIGNLEERPAGPAEGMTLQPWEACVWQLG